MVKTVLHTLSLRPPAPRAGLLTINNRHSWLLFTTYSHLKCHINLQKEKYKNYSCHQHHQQLSLAKPGLGCRGTKGGEFGSWKVWGCVQAHGNYRGTLMWCEVLGEGFDSLERQLFLPATTSKLGSLQLMHHNWKPQAQFHSSSPHAQSRDVAEPV